MTKNDDFEQKEYNRLGSCGMVILYGIIALFVISAIVLIVMAVLTSKGVL